MNCIQLSQASKEGSQRAGRRAGEQQLETQQGTMRERKVRASGFSGPYPSAGQAFGSGGPSMEELEGPGGERTDC